MKEGVNKVAVHVRCPGRLFSVCVSVCSLHSTVHVFYYFCIADVHCFLILFHLHFVPFVGLARSTWQIRLKMSFRRSSPNPTASSLQQALGKTHRLSPHVLQVVPLDFAIVFWYGIVYGSIANRAMHVLCGMKPLRGNTRQRWQRCFFEYPRTETQIF